MVRVESNFNKQRFEFKNDNLDMFDTNKNFYYCPTFVKNNQIVQMDISA